MQAHTVGQEAFAAQLNPSGVLQWNTFLGGNGDDLGRSIAVDGSGNVYVAGYSNATWGTPVQAHTVGQEAFAAQLNPSGVRQWSTFLGGSGAEYVRSMAVDGSGNMYVAGYSTAAWGGAPVRAYTLSDDAFVAMLAPSYTVTFSANGGSGSMSPQVASSATALTSNAFTRAGYTFAGWNTVALGGGTAYANGASYPFTADVMLYAQWACSNAISVTSNADSDAGSLRQAIADVCANGTITFDNSLSGATINLASTLTLAKNVTIDGSALANQITISGDTAPANGTGDVRVFYVNSGMTVNLKSLTVTKGYVTGADGGGLYNNGGTVSISNNAFFDNYSDSYGGGIYDAGTMTITGSVFKNNNGDSGGGGIAKSGGTLNITNSTFSGNNTSLNEGGALSKFSGTANITNSTFSGNSAVYGGDDIASYAGTTLLKNTIVASNSAVTNCLMNFGTLTADTSNIDVDGTCDGALTSSSINLGSLGNYGGSTETFTLLPDSSALGAGDAATCAAAPVNNLDQRGVARPQGSGNCDIGAFESGLNPSQTVTFDGNGATGGSMSNQVASSATALTANAFTRASYTFTGWNTLANGTGTPYTDGASYPFTADITLYAQWTANNNTITFNGNGFTGGSTATQTLATDATAALTANGFTRTNYTFAGWATTAGGAVAYADGANYTMGTANVTLYAQWACSSALTVTSNADSGAGSLRQAMTDVCDGGSITFNNNYTITLASQLPAVSSKTITITGQGAANTIIQANAAPNTATYRVFEVSAGGNLTLDQLTVRNGRCAGACATDLTRGGGIYNNGGALTIKNSVISNNSASGTGGGIYIGTGTLNMLNSNISNNTASTAGGIGSLTGTVSVTNSTLSGNSASAGGGAIRDSGTLNVTNSTFSGNTAANGSSITHSAGAFNLKNSVLADGTGKDCNLISGALTTTNNLIQSTGANACNITNGANGNIIGSTPLLGTLGNYGGATQTYPLLPGSPAIDAGDATTCAGLSGGDLDQRGSSRVGTCDIGSFESQGFTFGTLTGTPQSTNVNTSFGTALGLTVSANNVTEPVIGGQVKFTPPGSGASASITSSPATIGSDSKVSVTAAANGTAGTYNVVASALGASNVNFALTNAPVYTVTYNGNSNDGGTLPTDSTLYNTGNTVNVLFTPLPTKTGYTFAGWSDGSTTYTSGGTTSFSMGSSNVTLTAQWVVTSYTVTFDGNGSTGGSTATQTLATGATAALTTNGFSRTGYTFAGWATSAGGAVAYADGANYTMGTANVTLYAKWTVNQYTISFEENGGSTVTDITDDYGATVSAPTAPIAGHCHHARLWHFRQRSCRSHSHGLHLWRLV
ncbi:MAG: InlB B-repeat-containing protein [Anaerolineales bacterium]|nr:InlB B-repeat-containing protein [Anaerolineales bacterium]